MPQTKSKPSPSPEPTTTTHPTGSQQGTSPMTFEDILNTPAEQVEAPRPIPAGSWTCLVDGNFEQGKSKTKETPFIRFKLKTLAPGDDVSAEPEEIQKATGRSINAEFYFAETNTDLAKHQLKQFLIACGIEDAGKTLSQMLAEAPGTQVLAIIEHEMTKPTDGSEPQVLARARRFAKV